LLHRPRQFVLLGLVLIFCLQACSSVDYGSSDDPKTGYIYGTVVGITDGDTLTILTAINKTAKIRLSEIDTPERRQPCGKRARQELSALTFQKPVVVRVADVDRYQRIVGRIYVDALDVSAEMVRLGAAWVYRKYAEDGNLYVLEEMKPGKLNVSCGSFQRLRGCRRGVGGVGGDLHMHTRRSLVRYHLYGFRFNMTEMVSVRFCFDSNPPFINAAFSGLSAAILCCYHLDRK